MNPQRTDMIVSKGREFVSEEYLGFWEISWSVSFVVAAVELLNLSYMNYWCKGWDYYAIITPHKRRYYAAIAAQNYLFQLTSNAQFYVVSCLSSSLITDRPTPPNSEHRLSLSQVRGVTGILGFFASLFMLTQSWMQWERRCTYADKGQQERPLAVYLLVQDDGMMSKGNLRVYDESDVKSVERAS